MLKRLYGWASHGVIAKFWVGHWETDACIYHRNLGPRYQYKEVLG
jgi:hypothetical protein